VLIKFTADWCANCHVVERVVFGDPKTAEVLARHDVVVIKADLTQSDAAGWPLLRELSPGGGIPFTVVYTPDGQIVAKLESIYTSDALAAALARLR
jgi:thiol:disulfide interchange protein